MKHLLACLAILAVFNVHAQGWNASNDVDQDGCVGVGDVLQILSMFGSCDEGWQCGDTLEYDNYWYETVLIDDQCWFADNLRSNIYSNEDTIPVASSSSEFSSANGPMCRVHPSSDDIGYHYNFYCVEDNRNLCPPGWLVPSDDQWLQLENFLGVESTLDICFRSGGGNALKSSANDSPEWDGTNSSGFSAIPSGYVDTNGQFQLQGNRANFWSSSRIGARAIRRRLDSANEGVNRDVYSCDNIYLRLGFSVRCLKDVD